MRKSQKSAVVIGSVVAITGAGIAFAAWTSTGTGTGSATAGEAVNLVVEGNDISGLYPTGTFPATVEITNPNPYDVTLSSLDFTGAEADKAGCDASRVTVVDLTGLSDVVVKDDGSVTKNVVVSMSNDAVDACQNAVFTLSYTASGASS